MGNIKPLDGELNYPVTTSATLVAPKIISKSQTRIPTQDVYFLDHKLFHLLVKLTLKTVYLYLGGLNGKMWVCVAVQKQQSFKLFTTETLAATIQTKNSLEQDVLSYYWFILNFKEIF